MISVKFIQKGKGIGDLAKGLKKWQNVTLPSNCAKLGVETQAFMQAFIEANKKRPSGATPKLSKSVNLDVWDKGFGVGKISLLMPWWKVINFGFAGLIGKKFYGFFHPGEPRPSASAFRQGRFYESEDGEGYLMIPKKPIPPMNFIESTVHYLSSRIDEIVKGLNKL